MLNFENVTTKENFLNYIKENKMELKEAEVYGKSRKCWNLSDKFGNEWNITYNSNAEQYAIFNVCKYDFDIPVIVFMQFDKNKITITNAEKAGRKIKSDRLLKQFSQLAIMVNSCVHFGFLN